MSHLRAARHCRDSVTGRHSNLWESSQYRSADRLIPLFAPCSVRSLPQSTAGRSRAAPGKYVRRRGTPTHVEGYHALHDLLIYFYLPFQGCKALAKLGLYNNRITGGLEPLQGCVALQKVYLCHNQLVGPAELPYAELIC